MDKTFAENMALHELWKARKLFDATPMVTVIPKKSAGAVIPRPK